MTGLIIEIKDNGFLAVSILAAEICVLHIDMCSKVPLVRSLLGFTLSMDNTWPLRVSDHPRMFINAGVNIDVYGFDIKSNYRQFELCHE